jgi:hypothetical protein
MASGSSAICTHLASGCTQCYVAGRRFFRAAKFAGKGWGFSPSVTQSHKVVGLGRWRNCPLYSIIQWCRCTGAWVAQAEGSGAAVDLSMPVPDGRVALLKT